VSRNYCAIGKLLWILIYICNDGTFAATCRHQKGFFSAPPVKKAYLFGSYSRKDANENSDIDILVELGHSTPIGMQFFTYSDKLRDLLNKKVDVVSYEGFSKYVKPIIDKEKVLIYEKR